MKMETTKRQRSRQIAWKVICCSKWELSNSAINILSQNGIGAQQSEQIVSFTIFNWKYLTIDSGASQTVKRPIKWMRVGTQTNTQWEASEKNTQSLASRLEAFIVWVCVTWLSAHASQTNTCAERASLARRHIHIEAAKRNTNTTMWVEWRPAPNDCTYSATCSPVT